MDSGIALGRVWNVPIRLHLSWFLIAGLITWSLATGYYPQSYPNIPTSSYWIMGIVTAVLFAASVLLHELGHVFMALRERIPVRGVTLFLFGGVAQINEEPKSAGAEFKIAIAGPLVSLALSGLFGVLWLLDQAVPFLAAPSEYLMRINFLLAAFNMIPGFPLDGGRVLRAAVWKFTGSSLKATRVASTSGQLVAFGFIGFGVFTIFTGNFFNGLWLAFIGWFLQNAAASALQNATVEKALEGVKVSQVMQNDFPHLSGLTTLDQIVNDRVLHSGQRLFLVQEEGEITGIITLQNIAAIPQRQWPFLTARQVMSPVQRVEGIAPYMELMAALRKMELEQKATLPVVVEQRLVGVLSHDDILRYLRLRSELNM